MKRTENILGRLVGVAFRSLRKQLTHNISQSDISITAEQGIILTILSHYDKMNQQMITDFIHCEKTAVTRWLDYLESMNLVKRTPDKIDRRQNLLELTPEGKKYAVEFLEIGQLTENQALQGVDKEHIKICKDVLKQIAINLETTN